MDKLTPFINISGIVAPLHVDNVDTDQIIPAEFLKITDQNGLGQHVFSNWRSEPNFILNQSEYQHANILLAHENFGCGSSREHAVWALQQFGFRAVVAISFADIFRNNAMKKGLLTIVLPPEEVDAMHKQASTGPQTMAVNLEQQTVTWNNQTYHFEIDGFAKARLLKGVDDIGYTLQFNNLISAYEEAHSSIRG